MRVSTRSAVSRTARTAAQAGGAGVVVGVITELTGYVPGPNTAIAIGAVATVAAAFVQNVAERRFDVRLPGVLARDAGASPPATDAEAAARERLDELG